MPVQRSKQFLHERRRAQVFFNRISFLFPIIERRLLPDYRRGLNLIDLSRQSSVLDIATGTGLLAGAFKERGHSHVSGLDFSRPMIERASGRHPSIDFRLFDLVHLEDIAPSSFDVVSMGFFLHGVSPEFRGFVLSQAARICRDAVVVFDYFRGGNPFVSLIEWIEGPYYKQFIRSSRSEEFMAAGLSMEMGEMLSGLCGVWLCRPCMYKKTDPFENQFEFVEK